MYRASAFVLSPSTLVRAGSASTYDEAVKLLDWLTSKLGASGGLIESHVPGIGWVVAEEDDDS